MLGFLAHERQAELLEIAAERRRRRERGELGLVERLGKAIGQLTTLLV